MSSPSSDCRTTRASLELADWRRQVAALYEHVRDRATDPVAAWNHWRAVRDDLYRHHPQSPVPATARAAFRGLYWPYEPGLRFEVVVDTKPGEDGPDGTTFTPRPAPALNLPMSTGEALDFTRIGEIAVPFPGGTRTLGLFWIAGYAGGLFLPFRDATNGTATYGAGRYLLDTAKGADLGGDPAKGTVILDFNFAFQPSCAFDPQWSCPLAPAENRLDVPIEAGERIA